MSEERANTNPTAKDASTGATRGEQPQPETPKSDPKPTPSASSGLPWIVVAAAAAGFFLFTNRDKLASPGAFIYVIGAVFLAVSSANMLGRK